MIESDCDIYQQATCPARQLHIMNAFLSVVKCTFHNQMLMYYDSFALSLSIPSQFPNELTIFLYVCPSQAILCSRHGILSSILSVLRSH